MTTLAGWWANSGSTAPPPTRPPPRRNELAGRPHVAALAFGDHVKSAAIAEDIEAIRCAASKTGEHASMPERIQLKRTKGWRMPPGTVKVDRTTRWGNPFVQGEVSEAARLGHPVASALCGALVRDRAHAVELFQQWIFSESDVALAWRNSALSLRGKNLACWCPLDGPCHANVLLRLANAAALR